MRINDRGPFIRGRVHRPVEGRRPAARLHQLGRTPRSAWPRRHELDVSRHEAGRRRLGHRLGQAHAPLRAAIGAEIEAGQAGADLELDEVDACRPPRRGNPSRRRRAGRAPASAVAAMARIVCAASGCAVRDRHAAPARRSGPAPSPRRRSRHRAPWLSSMVWKSRARIDEERCRAPRCRRPGRRPESWRAHCGPAHRAAPRRRRDRRRRRGG